MEDLGVHLHHQMAWGLLACGKASKGYHCGCHSRGSEWELLMVPKWEEGQVVCQVRYPVISICALSLTETRKRNRKRKNDLENKGHAQVQFQLNILLWHVFQMWIVVIHIKSNIKKYPQSRKDNLGPLLSRKEYNLPLIQILSPFFWCSSVAPRIM